jgi:hypothetical protein
MQPVITVSCPRPAPALVRRLVETRTPTGVRPMSCRTSIPRVRSVLRTAVIFALFPVAVSCTSARSVPHAADAAQVATRSAAVPAAVDEAIAALRAEYAPDRRVARFDVEASRDDGVLVVTGETTTAAARAAFAQTRFPRHRLSRRDHGPAGPGARRPDWALANNSVANLRTTPATPPSSARRSCLVRHCVCCVSRTGSTWSRRLKAICHGWTVVASAV